MESFKGGDSLLDELHSLTQLLFGDNQRRRKADDVLVSRLSQNTKIAHLQADIPSLFSVTRLDDDSVEKTLTADFLNHRALEVAHLLAENLSEAVSVLHEVLVLDNLKGCDGDLGCDGVAAEG